MSSGKKPRGGRPPRAEGEKLQRINLTLRPSLLFGLELLARAQHRSLSQAVEWAIQVGLNAYEFRGESDYLHIGQIVEELWKLPAPIRVLRMAEHARSLLSFEELAAADFVLRSEEYEKIKRIADPDERIKARQEFETWASERWEIIVSTATKLANDGVALTLDGARMPIRQNIDHHASVRSAAAESDLT